MVATGNPGAARVVCALLLAAPLCVGCSKKHEASPLEVKAEVATWANGKVIITVPYLASDVVVTLSVPGVPADKIEKKKTTSQVAGGSPTREYIIKPELLQGNKTYTATIVARSGTRSGKTTVTFKRHTVPAAAKLVSVKTHEPKAQPLTAMFDDRKSHTLWVSPSGEATVTFEASAGTKITLGGKSWTAAAGKTRWAATINVTKVLLQQPAKPGPYIEVPVKLVSAENKQRTVPLRFYAKTALAALLLRARQAPVLAPGEAPSKRRAAVARVRRLSGGAFTLDGYVGPAKRVKDFDLVAVIERAKPRSKRCGVYRGSRTGKRTVISNLAIDASVAVYARTTGKLVKKTRIRAKMPACPHKISSRYTGVKASVARSKVNAWLRRLIHS